MRIKHSLLVPFFLLAACVGEVTMDPIQDAPHAMKQRDPDDVQLFTAGAPAREHVDVAVLHAPYGLTNDERIAQLHASAARMGCDGLVLQNSDAGWTGTCIVYR